MNPLPLDQKMTLSHFIYEDEKVGVKGLSGQELSVAYLNWFSDQQVCAYNTHGWFPQTLERLAAYIESVAHADNKIVWAIYDKATLTHVGNASLTIFNRIDNTAELALMLGEKQFWGCGLGFKASRWIMQHGFYALNLHRIYCATASNNKAMKKLALKLGFIQEGVRRQSLYLNGNYDDEIEYGVLRHEFLSE